MGNWEKFMVETETMARLDQIRNNISLCSEHIVLFEREIEKCRHERENTIKHFVKEYAQFKKGDIVCFKEHKNKVRYVVYDVYGEYPRFSNKIQICYKLQTFNNAYGVRNGGTIYENELEPYKK